MKSFRFKTWSVPLALLAVSLLSYAPLITRLGFYWDDWPAVWYFHNLGSGAFGDVFSVDRPLLGRLFSLTTPLFRESPLAWQAFGIAARWLSSLALWWVLRSLWPDRARQAAWVALLFAVYPGFSQQYIAVTYSHIFVVLSIFFASFGAMIWAVRRPHWFWPLMIVSLLASALSMFTVEYFFGLELLRPALLWLALSERTAGWRQRLRKTLLYWAPYLALAVLFLLWRVFFSQTPRGEVKVIERFLLNPFRTLAALFVQVLEDSFEAGLLAWGRTLVDGLRALDFGLIPAIAYGLVVLAGAVLAFVYLSRLQTEDSTVPENRAWAFQALAIGLFSFAIAGWPFWATDLPLRLEFPWDRFTLPMMLGSSLVLIALVELLRLSAVRKGLLVAVLVGLAAGAHFLNAYTYVQDWKLLRSFAWQLEWRAPDIEPGTTLLTSILPFRYYTDNSLTAPLNWQYDPENPSREMSYLMLNLEARLGVILDEVLPDRPIAQEYRATTFTGNTSKAFVLFYDPPRCLKVIDPARDTLWPKKPRFIDEAVGLSQLDLIQPQTRDMDGRLPAYLLGTEPEGGWCYYFQKAELARQYEDWQQVAELGDRALALLENPKRDAPEWASLLDGSASVKDRYKAAELAPFVEGYAYTGQWDRAAQLTQRALAISDKLQPFLCTTWRGISANTARSESESRAAALEEMRASLSCAIP